MKRSIFTLALFLCASVVVAEDYTVMFLDNTISSNSFSLFLTNVKEAGGDVAVIDQSKMPVWREKADTNVVGKVLCVRTDSLGVNEWKNKSMSYVETRVTKDMPPPDKQKVKVITRAGLKENYEPIPEEE